MLTTRLERAVTGGQIRADVDLGIVANALIGTLLLHTLNRGSTRHDPAHGFNGIVEALLDGVTPTGAIRPGSPVE